MFGEYILQKGFSYSDENKIYKSTILERFNLAIELSRISTQRGKFDSEIFDVLHNYLKYFIDFFDYLCQQDVSSLYKMITLRDYLEPEKYKYPEFIEFQKKITEYKL